MGVGSNHPSTRYSFGLRHRNCSSGRREKRALIPILRARRLPSAARAAWHLPLTVETSRGCLFLGTRRGSCWRLSWGHWRRCGMCRRRTRAKATASCGGTSRSGPLHLTVSTTRATTHTQTRARTQLEGSCRSDVSTPHSSSSQRIHKNS